MTPPRRPQPWLDPDPLDVQLQPVPRILTSRSPEVLEAKRRAGIPTDEPAPSWLAWFGLGVCVGILLGALIMLGALWFDAAPSPAPHPTVIVPRDLSGLLVDASDPAQGGAPLADATAVGAPTPSTPMTPRPPDVTGANVGAQAMPSRFVPDVAGRRLPETTKPSPASSSGIGTAVFQASATWCAPTRTQCLKWGGTALLAALPTYTGHPYVVRVTYGSRHVDVRVVSICGCGIDLSPFAFEQLAPLSRGRIPVTVEGPILPLPATDSAP